MVCRLCGKQKARRACPALGEMICAVCCGTKRMVEIRCPTDCTYLVTSLNHPAAETRRRWRSDRERLGHALQDLNDHQSRLFVLLATKLATFQPAGFGSLQDVDVASAARALAATLETAARGVLYDHPADSPLAEALLRELKPLVTQSRSAGHASDRDTAVVLRRLEELAGAARRDQPAETRSLLDFFERLAQAVGERERQDREAREPSGPARLIVP